MAPSIQTNLNISSLDQHTRKMRHNVHMHLRETLAPLHIHYPHGVNLEIRTVIHMLQIYRTRCARCIIDEQVLESRCNSAPLPLLRSWSACHLSNVMNPAHPHHPEGGKGDSPDRTRSPSQMAYSEKSVVHKSSRAVINSPRPYG